MSSNTGWKPSPSQRILLVKGEEGRGHFRGEVALPAGSEFRIMLTNTDPADPGMAHMAGDIWFSLTEYPLVSSGINNVAV
jgi:hypothetical protein